MFGATWLIFGIVLGLTAAGYAHSADKREITVLILVDQELYAEKEKIEVEADILNLIWEASKKFEKEFSITFKVVNFEPWLTTIEKELDIQAAYLLLQKATHNSADIVLAFTHKDVFVKMQDLNGREVRVHSGGYAIICGRKAIIGLKGTPRLHLLHELGHLFCAKHTQELSVMNGEVMETEDFDEKNSAVIRENRNKNFK